MKQRLAIAATLMKTPDLLILDEPTNGLDPAGIRDIRQLMRRVADEGATVLLSSHLLSEVQTVCDSVTIVARGKHIRSGRVSDVLAERGTGEVRVGLADPGAGARVLIDAGMALRTESDHLLVSEVDDPAVISRALALAGLYVRELTPMHADLESVSVPGTDRY